MAPRLRRGHLAQYCADGEDRAPWGGRSGDHGDPAILGATVGREAAKMPELLIGKVADIAEGDRRIVTHEGLEIGVFHWQGRAIGRCTPTPI
jgi:hypothetical protein